MKTIIYARYSPRPAEKTPTQTIGVQVDSCMSYAKAKDWEVTGVFKDEAVSGGSFRRPEFTKAIKETKDCKGVLLVYNLSRFARSLELTLKYEAKLRNAGCQLASVSESIDTTTAAGRLMFSIQGAMNEYFRSQLSEVTSAALQRKISKGERVGGRPPYGYKHIGEHRVRDEDEQIVLELCRKLFLVEGLTRAQGADRLNQEGYQTRSGKEWNSARVKFIYEKIQKEG